jgi:hypothetical protein
MQLNQKAKNFFNYFLGPALLVVFSISLYNHIQEQKDWTSKWTFIKSSVHDWRLYLVGLLMLVNYGFEAVKWRVLMKHVHSISFWKAYKSVLAGSSLTFVTPNRTGEYVGRIIYVQEGNRLKAIPLSIVGGISQLLVTLVFGTVSLMFLKQPLSNATASGSSLSSWWMLLVLIGSGMAAAFLLLLYFKLSVIAKVVERLPAVKKISYLFEVLDNFENKELLQVLMLSTFRFFVFVLQYLLMMQLFAVDVSIWMAIWGVCTMFLILAIVPSFAFVELGMRGEAAIQVFAHLGVTNTLGLLITAYGIWCINILLPALIGTIFILGTKIFKNKE